MGRIEKTVFISYRRTNFYTALAVYQDLTAHGYDVFFDYQSIDSGNFEKAILENIEARAHFVLVLSSSALERCSQPNDWLRREIEAAIELKRNIVPLMMEEFDFGSPTTVQALSGKLATLNTYNGLRLYSEYFFDGMEKLRSRFLNKALDDQSSREVSSVTRVANETNKAVANEAAPVEAAQLTAEEWFERAYVFQKEENLDEAFRCFSKAVELNPSYDSAYYNLGILLNDLKRNDEAEAAYRKAIEFNPYFDKAYSNLGVLLSGTRRNDEAEAVFRKAIELNPSLTEAYGNLGNLLRDLKRYEEAEAAYHKVIELNPSDEKAYSNLGLLLSELKRNEEAEAAYRKAIELTPSQTKAYANLGVLLRNLKRYDEAEAAYRKVIELNPSDEKTYSNLGLLLSNLKRNDEAEAAYRKAIELNPFYEKAYSNLGLLLSDLKRNEEAEAAYRKAIELNPADDSAYNNLVILLRMMNRIEDAMPLLEKLIEITPEDFNPFLALSSIGKQLGKNVSAEHLAKARQFLPEDDWYNRACLESVCDNFDTAFEYLEKAAQLERFNSGWAWDDPDLQWLRDDPRFVKIVGPRQK